MNIMSEQVNELFTALSEAQGELTLVEKTAKGNRSTYATLGDLIKDTRHTLRKFGLCVSQLSEIHDGKTVIITLLSHKSGQWLKGTYPLDSIDLSPQQKGSAYTYARRYNLMAILNLTGGDEDDDGQKAQDEFNKIKLEKEQLNLSENHLMLIGQVLTIYTNDKGYAPNIKSLMDRDKIVSVKDISEKGLQGIITMYKLWKEQQKTKTPEEIEFVEELKKEF